MNVDRITFADLEFFSTTSGEAPLFQLFDRCRTRAGSTALRRRFQHPLSDADEIRAVQSAVTYWESCGWQPVADTSLLAAIETYLASNVTVLRAKPALDALVESAWVRLRYKAEYQVVAAGVRQVIRFLNHMDHVADRLAVESPSLLGEIRSSIRAALDAGDVARLRSTSARSALAVLRADRVFRTSARRELDQLIQLLGELDALRTMYDVGQALRLTKPAVVDGGEFLLEGEGVFHLALPDSVRNPVHVSRGEVLVFITGPNMAGKSTYLRAVGVACLLAHCGMGVPARRFRFSPIDRLLTSLNPTDNIRRGVSYFMAEVDRVREAATYLAAGDRCLMMFDEVFRGTNVHDAMDASRTVIAGFARAKTSGFIFASHLVELVEDLQAIPSIRFACFDGEIVAGAPMYEYALRPGASSSRFGMVLLEQAEVPALLARIVDAR